MERQSPPRNRYSKPFWLGGGVSTGLRLFIILLAVLLPLAMMALLATQRLAQRGSEERYLFLETMVDQSAARLDLRISDDQRYMVNLKQRYVAGEEADTICTSLRRRFRLAPNPVYAAIEIDDAPRCTYGRLPEGLSDQVNTTSQGVFVVADQGMAIGQAGFNESLNYVIFYPAGTIQTIVDPLEDVPISRLELRDQSRSVKLTSLPPNLERQLDDVIVSKRDIDGLRLSLSLSKPKPSSPQFVALTIPFLMMLAAACMGWLVVDRMLIGPVDRLRRKMRNYETGQVLESEPPRLLDAAEIHEIDGTFVDLSRQVAMDKDTLDQNMVQQIGLTREVHHRVKNNLQVIASLISLHARDAQDIGVANAYTSIQRRVDALSVVHRHHFAEGEGSAGMPLDLIIKELMSSFRVGQNGSCRFAAVDIDVAHVLVNQDIAIAVAFLVTEIVEMIGCDTSADRLSISSSDDAGTGRVMLVFRSDALAAGGVYADIENTATGRVLQGLSRQLRTPLLHDPDGCSLRIAVSTITPEASDGD